MTCQSFLDVILILQVCELEVFVVALDRACVSVVQQTEHSRPYGGIMLVVGDSYIVAISLLVLG